MVVIISNDVLNKINDYATALTMYPITAARITEKIDDMVSALNKLGVSIARPPICMFKDLGQVFDASGKPINQNLKRFNYKDKSGFQWAFGCLYDDETDKITVIKMLAANQVREAKQKKIFPILEFMRRLDAIK